MDERAMTPEQRRAAGWTSGIEENVEELTINGQIWTVGWDPEARQDILRFRGTSMLTIGKDGLTTGPHMLNLSWELIDKLRARCSDAHLRGAFR